MEIKCIEIVLTTSALLLTAFTIYLNLQKSRRELASMLVYNWANDNDWATTSAIVLARTLTEGKREQSPDVIAAILEKEKIELEEKYFASVISILGSEFEPSQLPKLPSKKSSSNENVKFLLEEEHSAYIRYLWIKWLNRLEGTLAAWQQGAADRDLMEKEFSPLVIGVKSQLSSFTEIVEGLPVTKVFHKKMNDTGKIKLKPLWW